MDQEQLFLEAARVAKMIKGSDIDMKSVVKYRGEFSPFEVTFRGTIEDYEFALAIVEGKPVFKGDMLFHYTGGVYKMERGSDGKLNSWNIECWSWNPPKPKTVMVEMLVEDASYVANVGLVNTKMVQACRKALEGLKS